MDTISPIKTLRDNSNQIDPDSRKGRGLSALKGERNAELFTAIDQRPTPEYRQNLVRVFKEEFLAENSKKDLGSFMEQVQKRDWLTLKRANPVINKIYQDLSITPTCCFLYDNRLVISTKLQPLVLQTIHSKHQGPAECSLLHDWCGINNSIARLSLRRRVSGTA